MHSHASCNICIKWGEKNDFSLERKSNNRGGGGGEEPKKPQHIKKKLFPTYFSVNQCKNSPARDVTTVPLRHSLPFPSPHTENGGRQVRAVGPGRL